jgi:hypothetical protein
MSAASTPAPRVPTGSSSSSRSHTLFWPFFVFLLGFGTFTIYQVMFLEDQLAAVTKAVDQMDSKVKLAQYEKTKFFALSRDVLKLAPKDEAAKQVVDELKLQQLEVAEPTMMDGADLTPSVAPDTTTNVSSKIPPVTPLK